MCSLLYAELQFKWVLRLVGRCWRLVWCRLRRYSLSKWFSANLQSIGELLPIMFCVCFFHNDVSVEHNELLILSLISESGRAVTAHHCHDDLQDFSPWCRTFTGYEEPAWRQWALNSQRTMDVLFKVGRPDDEESRSFSQRIYHWSVGTILTIAFGLVSIMAA